MNEKEKKQILSETQKHLDGVICSISNEHKKAIDQIRNLNSNIHEYDDSVRKKIGSIYASRADELYHLQPSPFVARCDVSFGDTDEALYFGKFSLIEESIYSWITPAARIRFENLGDVSYELADGEKRQGKLSRKDQFLIAKEKIVFMASESEEYERTLIHQEYLTDRKTGFVLPEIIAQMEKAQDKVIRANPTGSFHISGPAGSGKTTLALHRIAYLLQSPETIELYGKAPIIVFVQDESTRQYFSSLLPELGIHNVEITTYGSWVLDSMGLGEYICSDTGNEIEGGINWNEISFKKAAIPHDKLPKIVGSGLDPFGWLRGVYSGDEQLIEALDIQEDEKRLDQFDLSFLQSGMVQRDGALLTQIDRLFEGKNSRLIRKKEIVPLQYSLIMLDEVQNYTAKQIQTIQSCIHPDTKSMLYIGDLGQRTRIGSITAWNEVDEEFSIETCAELKKVYRNTGNILRYIKNQGYDIEIPDVIPNGCEVIEYQKSEEAVKNIDRIVSEKDGLLVGVLGFNNEDLQEYEYLRSKKVKVMTIKEAQGVEFDTVVLVGVSDDILKPIHENRELEEELRHINRNLFYVGLTRAMQTLVVVMG